MLQPFACTTAGDSETGFSQCSRPVQTSGDETHLRGSHPAFTCPAPGTQRRLVLSQEASQSRGDRSCDFWVCVLQPGGADREQAEYATTVAGCVKEFAESFLFGH